MFLQLVKGLEDKMEISLRNGRKKESRRKIGQNRKLDGRPNRSNNQQIGILRRENRE